MVAHRGTPSSPVRHASFGISRGGKHARMRIAKQELVRVLRTQGDNNTADKAESQLPDEIDTDGHADQLAAIGLDGGTLQAKLAGGALGGTLAP